MQPPRQAEPIVPSYIHVLFMYEYIREAKNISMNKNWSGYSAPPLSTATNENIRGAEPTNRNVSATFRSMRSAGNPADQWHGASGGRAHGGDIQACVGHWFP
jgi:hypothetical protein